MKKLYLISAIVLIALASASQLCQVYASQTLSKPNVTLPSNKWSIAGETAYPNGPSEFDQAGGGMVKYRNSDNGDVVSIYYENAPSQTFTSSELKDQAVSLFQRDINDATVSESGTQQYAGVTAGYAKGTDSYTVKYVVFIKDGIYYNVIAGYDPYTQNEQDVNSIINSISMAGSGSVLGGPMLYIIIIVIVAVVVVVVVLAAVMSRKKKAKQQQMPPPMAPGMVPPPPPPT
jgi:hypothetical protein